MSHFFRSRPLLDLALNHRKGVFWALGLLTLAFSALLPLIQIDTDPENMLPTDNPARVFHNQVKDTFDMHDTIVVGVVSPNGLYNPETLANLHRLSEYAESLEGVIRSDLMSLATIDNITQEEAGSLRFEWMMREPPDTREQALAIQANVERLPMLFNTLVSEDGQAAAIYVPVKDKNESYAIGRLLQQHIEGLDSRDDWYITGLPIAEDRFGHEMFVQMAIAAPLAGLVIFLLLWLFFRNIPFIVAPMIVALSTVLITMGALIGAGFTVHIMSSMIAIFLMPIAVVDSVHILSEFADRYRKGDNPHTVVREVMGHLLTPMLFTSITSTVGFFSLMLTPIPPVQIFGFFVGFGIMLAFFSTIVFIPAYLVSLNPATLDRMVSNLPDENATLVARLLSPLGRLARRNAKLWVTGFSALFAVSVWGITQIQVNDNPVRWFKSDHELRIADRALNDHFAGTYDAFMVLSADTKVLEKARAEVGDLLSARTLNDDAHTWLQAQSDGLTRAEDLPELILALDDYLFEAPAGDTSELEGLLSRLETMASASQAFTRPDNLAYIERLQAHLEATGLVGKSNSLPDLVKTVNRELHSGQERDFELPDSANGVAQTLLQYQSSHRPQDLWHFVTPDYRQSLVWLQLTSGDNQDMTAVVDSVNEYLQSHPLPSDMTLAWAGKSYLNVIWQQEMVEGMIGSLISAFLAVLVMMILLFRSVLFGVLAMLPLTLTITGIYGLIGWMGKDYDMPIAVLSALTLGLSIDFAIHFIERARAYFRQTRSWSQTLDLMFREPGRAITRNAIVIAVGFTPLLFAPLVPYITVGAFLAGIMALSALVTLILLPTVMTLLQGWLFPHTDNP